MHPAIDKFLTRAAFTLCNFILMMRELQILSTTVNVEVISEHLSCHRRTFDMPSGSTVTIGRRPLGFTGPGRFPQDEIERIFFTRIDFDTFTGSQLVYFLARKLAVSCKSSDRKINIPVLRLIGRSITQQAVDHRDDRFNIIGGSGLMVRF